MKAIYRVMLNAAPRREQPNAAVDLVSQFRGEVLLKRYDGMDRKARLSKPPSDRCEDVVAGCDDYVSEP
jgi:hypothetical protein